LRPTYRTKKPDLSNVMDMDRFMRPMPMNRLLSMTGRPILKVARMDGTADAVAAVALFFCE
jgi:hypothetical protein